MLILGRIETDSRAIDTKVTSGHLDVAEDVIASGEEVLRYLSGRIGVALRHGPGDMIYLRRLATVCKERWCLLGVEDCRSIDVLGRTLLLGVKVTALLKVVVMSCFLTVLLREGFAIIRLRVQVFDLLNLFLPTLYNLK